MGVCSKPSVVSTTVAEELQEDPLEELSKHVLQKTQAVAALARAVESAVHNVVPRLNNRFQMLLEAVEGHAVECEHFPKLYTQGLSVQLLTAFLSTGRTQRSSSGDRLPFFRKLPILFSRAS